MAKKFYAVRSGRQTGIFTSWSECKRSITGYPAAAFKGFENEEDALEFLNIGKKTDGVKDAAGNSDRAAAYVDGSYNVKNGHFSYGAVIMYNGREYRLSEEFDDAELSLMRNVAGEIKGSEAAMDFCIKHGISCVDIYHDYEGIAKWCTGEWKTNKEGTKKYVEFYKKASEMLDIHFIKVKGHSGDKYNDIADALAKQALGIGDDPIRRTQKEIQRSDMMKKPDMIFFDYGQTLVGESAYDHKKGFKEVIKHISSNPENIDAQKLTDMYLSLRGKIWSGNKSNIEAHHNFLLRYIWEYFSIKSECDYDALEQIFWSSAVEFELMDGICEVLDVLHEKNIRTAVISNIDYSERTLEKIINKFIPDNHFEFIIASSEYIFRKPDKEIFELAMHKAGVNAENAWFIGNDEYYDAEGAAKNGLSAFWYTGSRFYKPKRVPECEYTRIEHWNDFIGIVREFS